jgi:hypothetical protein
LPAAQPVSTSAKAADPARTPNTRLLVVDDICVYLFLCGCKK